MICCIQSIVPGANPGFYFAETASVGIAHVVRIYRLRI